MSEELQRRSQAVRRQLAAARDREQAQAALAQLAPIAEAGEPAAQTRMGLCYQHGAAVQRDLDVAAAWFLRADEQGHATGTFLAAQLLTARDVDGGADPEGRTMFRRAAEAGHPGAACQLAYMLDHGLGGERDPGEATRWLLRTVRSGHARSCLMLAERYAQGYTLATDAARARGLVQVALAARYPLAEELAATLGDGDAVAADAAAPAVDDAAPPPAAPAIEERHAAPRVATIVGFASLSERAHLIARGEPFMVPSQVAVATGGNVGSQRRTSQEMAFESAFADVIVREHQRRAARLAGHPAAHAEPMRLLHYGAGEEYRPHTDYFHPDRGFDEELALAGQRLATFLSYLAPVAGGGATEFPTLGLEVPPEPGSALLFENVDRQGQPDPRTRHAGRPVTAGDKWIATLWFREQPYPA